MADKGRRFRTSFFFWAVVYFAVSPLFAQTEWPLTHDDPLVPYAGGGIRGGRRGSVISTKEAIRRWIAVDGCTGEPAVQKLPDHDPDDGCTVEESRWNSCSEGTAVELLRIEGGGHTWPGGAQYLPRVLIGRVCRDFDATEEIWRFFRVHPRSIKNGQ